MKASLASLRSTFAHPIPFPPMSTALKRAVPCNKSSQVQRYLAYQGTKFLSRFDANSFVELTKLMDTHDMGRDRKGGVAGALSEMTQPALIVSIDSDVLYPPYEQVGPRHAAVRSTMMFG